MVSGCVRGGDKRVSLKLHPTTPHLFPSPHHRSHVFMLHPGCIYVTWPCCLPWGCAVYPIMSYCAVHITWRNYMFPSRWRGASRSTKYQHRLKKDATHPYAHCTDCIFILHVAYIVSTLQRIYRTLWILYFIIVCSFEDSSRCNLSKLSSSCNYNSAEGFSPASGCNWNCVVASSHRLHTWCVACGVSTIGLMLTTTWNIDGRVWLARFY